MNSDEFIAFVLACLMMTGLGFGVKSCMGQEARARADFYNKTYGTSFSEHDAFWNQSQIAEYLDKKNPKRPQENNINATLKFDKG